MKILSEYLFITIYVTVIVTVTVEKAEHKLKYIVRLSPVSLNSK